MKEKAIDRIKKLLALSKSPNENEAAAALAKAMEICSEHDISIGDVEAIPQDETIEHKDICAMRQKTPAWEMQLSNGLARLFGCRVLITGYIEYGVKVSKLQFVGYTSDVEICTYVYEYLKRQVSRMTKEHIKTKIFRKRTTKEHYRECYLEGIVMAVLYKARQVYEKQHSNDQTPGLIVSRGALIDKYLNELGGDYHDIKHSRKNKSAVAAGIMDGSKVNLHRGMSAENNKTQPLLLNN